MRIIIDATPEEIATIVLMKECQQDIPDKSRSNKPRTTACAKSEDERNIMIRALNERIRELEMNS